MSNVYRPLSTKEFVIVNMLEPIGIGTRFAMWPLHMTLLPWFNAPDVETVKQQIELALSDFQPFEVEVGQREHFGQRKLPVMLIKNTPKLQALHETLLKVINVNGWDLPGRYTGEHFKPHVTHKAGRDASGTLKIDSVYIAEKQSQGYREIVGKIEL
jgi:2'-5' RNA ligase